MTARHAAVVLAVGAGLCTGVVYGILVFVIRETT